MINWTNQICMDLSEVDDCVEFESKMSGHLGGLYTQFQQIVI